MNFMCSKWKFAIRARFISPHTRFRSPSITFNQTLLQLQFEFKPEKLNGVILLTGERDDLTGDFIAVLINNGFIEFWYGVLEFGPALCQ